MGTSKLSFLYCSCCTLVLQLHELMITCNIKLMSGLGEIFNSSCHSLFPDSVDDYLLRIFETVTSIGRFVGRYRYHMPLLIKKLA